LFFNKIPDHIDAFVASWHEFEISIVLVIGFFHSLLFHVCVYWDWHLPKCCFSNPKSVPPLGTRRRVFGKWPQSLGTPLVPRISV